MSEPYTPAEIAAGLPEKDRVLRAARLGQFAPAGSTLGDKIAAAEADAAAQAAVEFDRRGAADEAYLGLPQSQPPLYPDGNPKTAAGAVKPSFDAIPVSALIPLGQAMADGKKKYGLTNWREKPVSTSVYYNAMLRHLFSFWDGEDTAEDSGVHHLGHAMACMAIILDARSAGKLNDDRPAVAGAFSRIVNEVAITGKTSLAPV